MVFPPGLVQNILSGRCFVLVGAGPSCEVGYPSWERLANAVFGEVAAAGKASDPQAYTDMLRSRQFPELYSGPQNSDQAIS